MFDITAIGELLIDMAQSGMSDIGSPIFEANPGGAPCNVLAMLNKLGRSTAFIGKVGDDIFGKKLKNIVESSGTDIGGLVFDENVRTTLAFVETDEYGDRNFSFYRAPGADMMLREDEVNTDIIKQSRVLHFGTLATVYKGNIIKNLIMDCQSYTKYRPNETTGGIFVSWRRKEELPTGA